MTGRMARSSPPRSASSPSWSSPKPAISPTSRASTWTTLCIGAAPDRPHPPARHRERRVPPVGRRPSRPQCRAGPARWRCGAPSRRSRRRSTPRLSRRRSRLAAARPARGWPGRAMALGDLIPACRCLGALAAIGTACQAGAPAAGPAGLCRGRVRAGRGAARPARSSRWRWRAATRSRQGDLLFALDPAERAERDEAAPISRRRGAARRPAQGQARPEIDGDRGAEEQAEACATLSELSSCAGRSSSPAPRPPRGTLDEARAELRARPRARRRAHRAARGRPPAGARATRSRAAEAESRRASGLAQAEWRLARAHGRRRRRRRWSRHALPAGRMGAAGAPVVALLPPGNVKVRFFVPEPRSARSQSASAVGLRLRRLRAEHDGADQLHRARGRVHAARHLQPREPREAGVHGRGRPDRRRAAPASGPAGRRPPGAPDERRERSRRSTCTA